MKITISIAGPVFEATESLAEELGLSRSRLYTEAVSEFVFRRSGAQVAQRLEEVDAGAESDLDPALQALQLASLPRDEW